MPSALETLVKILRLEQSTGFQDKAVIGGLSSFAVEWALGAHAQAKVPEHHALVDELVATLDSYRQTDPASRPDVIRALLGRITGRTPENGQPSGAEALAGKRPPPEPRRENRPPPPPPPKKPARPSAPPPSKTGRNDSHSLFGDRTAEPAPEEPRAAPPERAIPDITDFVLEPLANVEPELMELRPARAKLPPPRRRKDTRTPAEKAAALAALKKPVSELHGIGPRMAEKLESLEITTIEQLLFTFPRRYDDYTTMKTLNRLRPGELVSVAGMVRSSAVIKGKRNIDVFTVTLDDGTGVLGASFFNQTFLRTKILRGMQVVFSGKTDLYNGRIAMTNPAWELVDQDALTTRSVVPVYPLTAALSASNMRKATQAALEEYGDGLPDVMPAPVLDRTALAEYAWSVRQIHRPDSMDMLDHARTRLIFDDLILLQLGVLRNRREWQAVPADPLPVDDGWLEGFKDSLPFPLTGAQARAIAAIRADLATTLPMNRLLQGDVGAGKTVVAAAALGMALVNGHQGAIMAPTGILAEQHYRGLSRLFGRVPGMEGLQIRLLTGATPREERIDTLRGLADGSVQFVIGTHALIQDDVTFARLGLAVVDEQHRFGVEQRGKLRGKGTNPHLLVMTATPIPRTLALTLYADLDLTVLDEMPPGRTPIETRIILPRERERGYSFIQSQIAEGRQAFIVYPLVEASESDALSEVGSAIEAYDKLRSEVFPDLKIGLLHGRMSAAEKDAVMAEFSANRVQILVSTAVIEVGIDVPNATVMLIESANRFGLAQLHQFRGRVGRGQHISYCLLLAETQEDFENPRLHAMQETTDGFKLAEFDWKQRGAGDLLGTRQSGTSQLLAEYMLPHIVEMAQHEARALYAEDPLLTLPDHALLRQRLDLIYGATPGSEVS